MTKRTKNTQKQLREIAKQTHINFSRDLDMASGYVLPDPEGTFVFGNASFTTLSGRPTTKCNVSDLNRVCSLISQAKETCDYVFVQVHCHDNSGLSKKEPPDYLKEFSYACIDSGASAIFGGGCHQLRGIDMYKGLPIFYSFGDFIYQGPRVEMLPADFNEKYGVDKDAPASEALYARSRNGTVGLHTIIDNYLTVLPIIEYDGEKLSSVTLIPIDLNFEDKTDLNGLPVCSVKYNKEIFERLSVLSQPFGTELEFVKGVIKIKL